jgi:hypothetical protein
MEWYVGAFAGGLAVIDAITTHIGLKDGRAEETNPLWRRLYPILPLPAFIALLAGGQGGLSMLMFFLLGETAQFAHLAVTALVPISNVMVLLRSKR